MKAAGAAPRPDADPQWDSAWAELRNLLVGPEREEIGAIRQRLGNRSEQIESVAAVLPPAVERSTRSGPELRRSLEPLVREVVQLTLKHDPVLLVDAVLPVIGTLIRRYVSAALQDFVDAINIAQERSLSARSLRWRLEAWRSGKPFAEVVLANSLLYRVEQVFLIHRVSGLLLLHRTSRGVIAKDADMVSGMLTAIGDFARDSFEEGSGGELNTVQIGELRIWVRHGAHCALAAVVRGVAPPDLKSLLDRQLAAIERSFGGAIEHYAGDPATVEGAAPHVEACLVGQGGAEPRSSATAYAAAGLAAALLLAASGFWWWDHSRLESELHRMESEPGYAVTGARRGWLRHTITGLRDPLAAPPGEVLADASRYDLRFEPFLSLHPKMAALRDFEPVRQRIEASRLVFAIDSSIVNEAEARLAAAEIRKLAAAAPLAGKRFRVRVQGGADPSGTAERNAALSRQRAEAARDALVRNGVDQGLIDLPAASPPRSREAVLTVEVLEAER